MIIAGGLNFHQSLFEQGREGKGCQWVSSLSPPICLDFERWILLWGINAPPPTPSLLPPPFANKSLNNYGKVEEVGPHSSSYSGFEYDAAAAFLGPRNLCQGGGNWLFWLFFPTPPHPLDASLMKTMRDNLPFKINRETGGRIRSGDVGE